MGGNPSELDEVLAEGPPIPGPSMGGVLGGVGYWNEERDAAAHADLARDVSSDFDAATDAENAAWDHLADENASGEDRLPDPPTDPDEQG